MRWLRALVDRWAVGARLRNAALLALALAGMVAIAAGAVAVMAALGVQQP